MTSLTKYRMRSAPAGPSLFRSRKGKETAESRVRDRLLITSLCRRRPSFKLVFCVRFPIGACGSQLR